MIIDGGYGLHIASQELVEKFNLIKSYQIAW